MGIAASLCPYVHCVHSVLMSTMFIEVHVRSPYLYTTIFLFLKQDLDFESVWISFRNISNSHKNV